MTPLGIESEIFQFLTSINFATAYPSNEGMTNIRNAFIYDIVKYLVFVSVYQEVVFM
jgi:hypothetical protein